jgi:hypothetical protein
MIDRESDGRFIASILDLDDLAASPIGRQAATTSSRARKAMRLPATSPWSAAAATTTRALYHWGSG